MKLSVALAAAMFLPVLVNAQYNYPPPDTSTSDTESYTESSTESYPESMASGATTTTSAGTASPTVPAGNSTNINVSGCILFVASTMVC